ncbi:hypothetical protein BKA81DRAFT_289296, partial [Phyllosticta paracitricarpa]
PFSKNAIQQPLNCALHQTLLSPHHLPVTMSAAIGTEAAVYVRENFSEPMTPMHNFANQYDLDNPQASMHSYNRVMHEHTKLQLERATSSARRRS